MNIIERFTKTQFEFFDLRYHQILCNENEKINEKLKHLKVNFFYSIITFLLIGICFSVNSELPFNEVSYLFCGLAIVFALQFEYFNKYMAENLNKIRVFLAIIVSTSVILFGFNFELNNFIVASRTILFLILCGGIFLTSMITILLTFSILTGSSSYQRKKVKEILSTTTKAELDKKVEEKFNEISKITDEFLSSKENMLLLINRDKTNEGTHFTECYNKIYSIFKERTLKNAGITEQEIMIDLGFKK